VGSHSHARSAIDEVTQLKPGAKMIGFGLIVLGAVALAGAFFASQAGGSHEGEYWLRRFLSALLFGLTGFLAISCSALIFVLVNHLVRAGWITNVRRILETLAMQVPLMSLLLLPIIVVSGLQVTHEHDGHVEPIVHSWAVPADTHQHHHEYGSHEETHPAYPNEQVKPGIDRAYDSLIHEKRTGWLQPPIFLVRTIAYLVILSAVIWYFWSRSVAQDASGDVDISTRLGQVAAPTLMACGLLVTFVAFDVYMSLDPHWFSTMYGVYFFATGTQAMWATMILICLFLQKRGYLTASVTQEHYHDMGKFMFAFVVFFAYIAYSQYMLQWYANLPEETFWYDKRGYSTANPNGYSPLVIALLIGRFVIPFLGFVSRHVKRSRFGIGFWSAWLLVMFAIDVYLLVIPEFHWAATPKDLVLGPPEILCFVGAGALWLGNVIRMLASHALRPIKDPRTHESLALQNF
jgi:hypothetical protein